MRRMIGGNEGQCDLGISQLVADPVRDRGSLAPPHPAAKFGQFGSGADVQFSGYRVLSWFRTLLGA